MLRSALALAAGCTLVAATQSQPPVDPLLLKTGSPQGTYRVFGNAIAQIVNGAAASTHVASELSSGSEENLRALAAGDADLAISQGDMAYYPAHGLELFQGRPLSGIRALMALHAEEVLVIARSELGLRGASGLRPCHRVVVGEAGSGTMVNARNVLESMGLPMETVDTLMQSPRASLRLLSSGDVDVIFLTAGVSQDFLYEVEANGGEVLRLGEALVEGPQAQHPYYSSADLEVGGRTIRTLRTRSLLVSMSSVPEVEVQGITRSVYDNISTLRGAHPRGAEIFPANLAEGISIAQHPGALRVYCQEGLAHCETGFSVLVILVLIVGITSTALAFSGSARRAFIRWVPGAHRLVGPHGVTDRYRYVLILVLVGTLLVTGAFVIQQTEAAYGQRHNVRSDFEDIGLNENLVWMVVFTSTGFEDGRFPRSTAGKLTGALMNVAGIGGVLLTVRDHVIVCGWNERGAGIVRSLSDEELHERRRTVVIVADIDQNLVERHEGEFSPQYVVHLKGDPTENECLERAGLIRADAAIILADESVPRKDRDARSLLTLLHIEKLTYKWTQVGERDAELHSVVELVDPR